MMEIQKQLYRGEEVYFEETQAHGNLFRGWDAFIDLKDVGIHAGEVQYHSLEEAYDAYQPTIAGFREAARVSLAVVDHDLTLDCRFRGHRRLR
jgi:hypothetical protein